MQPTKLPIETLTKAEHFWAFFSAIPDEQWCMVSLSNHRGGHCALGHLGVTQDSASRYSRTPAALKLQEILSEDPFLINDGAYPHDKLGKTPRQRILAALRDKFGGAA